MKRLLAFVIAAALGAAALAQPRAHPDMKDEGRKADSAAAHRASGIVKKVDAANGRVTIAHGPVASLKWPGMTMAFTVKDKKLLEKLPVDKTVEFEIVQQGKDYVVTTVK